MYVLAAVWGTISPGMRSGAPQGRDLPMLFVTDCRPVQYFGQEIADLFFPPVPVVADVVSPEIAPCVDALILENTGHDQKSAYAVLLPGSLADAEDEGTLIVEPDLNCHTTCCSSIRR